MHTTLATDRRHDHPPQALDRTRVRRVGLLDRAALHLGVALITWSRRPAKAAAERRVTPRELNELRRQQEQALRRYELQRDLALPHPR